jgi:hypothetical protein
VIPKQVTVYGNGPRESVIQADASFPASTPLVKLGGESTTYEHNMWLENIAIDCNDVVGSTGVETRSANEPSGLRNCIVQGYRGRGVYVHTGGGFVANAFAIDDCEFFASTSGITDNSIYFDNVGLVSVIRRTTVSNENVTAGSDVAVRADDAAVYCESLHVEQHTHGIHVTFGSNNKGSLSVVGMTGHSSVDDLVYITDASPQTVIQAVTNGADDVVVNTLTGYSSVASGLYTEGLYSNWPVRVPAISRSVTHIDDTDFGIPAGAGEYIYGDTSVGTIYLSLPSAVGLSGTRYVIAREGANWISVYPGGGETISGATEKNITTNYGVLTVFSNDAIWIVESQIGTIT